MSKTYRPYEPNQAFLLPLGLIDWLPQGHLVHVLRDLVGSLYLWAILAGYQAEERRYPPDHPQMMVSVLLSAYGVASPAATGTAPVRHRRTGRDLAGH